MSLKKESTLKYFPSLCHFRERGNSENNLDFHFRGSDKIKQNKKKERKKMEKMCENHKFIVPARDLPVITIKIEEGDVNSDWRERVCASATLKLTCVICGEEVKFFGRADIEVDVG